MNITIKELMERRSVRAYEDRPIPAEEKKLILDAALQAPTAGNMTLYTILDITDQSVKDQLAVSCDHQPFIAKAPMVLIFCADYYRWYQLFCRHVDPVRTPAEGDLLLANADALIAAQNAVVAAESLGIGSCYIGDITENYEFHKALLHLPKHVVPACMVCFGYPTPQQAQRKKPARFETADIVHENYYHAEKSDRMEELLTRRMGFADCPELENWIEHFCARKWNSAFSEEMARSCAELVRDWGTK